MATTAVEGRMLGDFLATATADARRELSIERPPDR
jgi:hypothetical protein